MSVTQEQINAWKEEYGYVYRTIAGGEEIYFRTLTRDDYIDITTQQVTNPQGYDHDKEVFKLCVLNDYDERILRAKGGILAVVVEKIMVHSGFENIEVEEL